MIEVRARYEEDAREVRVRYEQSTIEEGGMHE